MIRLARTDDAAVIARVHINTWRTTYAGVVPEAYAANMNYERSHAEWARRLSSCTHGLHAFVVEAQPGQVVGFASGGPLREALPGFAGELYAVYVLKRFQGLGYGKRLVAEVARDLVNCGYLSMVIWVLKDNPACGFYEGLGGQVVADQVVEVGGKQLLGVAYGWPDLARFMPK